MNNRLCITFLPLTLNTLTVVLDRHCQQGAAEEPVRNSIAHHVMQSIACLMFTPTLMNLVSLLAVSFDSVYAWLLNI